MGCLQLLLPLLLLGSRLCLPCCDPALRRVPGGLCYGHRCTRTHRAAWYFTALHCAWN